MSELEDQVRVLEELQAGSGRLESIREASRRFNLFEAIGFVEQEIRHSRFLAFLMEPSANHGLGPAFARRFLCSAMGYEDAPVPPQEIGQADLSEIEVRREYKHVDILVTVESLSLVVVIENKVWSGERDGQLSRYYEAITRENPCRIVAGLYLTPFGETPSHEAYRSLSYREVCRVIDDVLGDENLTMDEMVRASLEQYTEMLRRNILGESEIQRLSRELYRDHGEAINIVVNTLANYQDQVHKLLKDLVDQTEGLSYGYRVKERVEDYLVFDHDGWGSPALNAGTKYKSSHRMLYFVFFSNLSGEIELWLEVGPGDETLRQRILDMAQDHYEVFPETPASVEEYVALYMKTILSSTESQQYEALERNEKIRERWQSFLLDDLSAMDASVKEAGLA
jgi:hypothetical protein